MSDPNPFSAPTDTSRRPWWRRRLVWTLLLLVAGAAAVSVSVLLHTQGPAPPEPISIAPAPRAPAMEAEVRRHGEARHPPSAEAEAKARQSSVSPTSVPQPSTGAPGPDFRSVDAALENLLSANVAFDTPQHAKVGKQTVIEAILSRHLSQDELKSLIKDPGAVEVGTLKVSHLMVATLSGGSAFDIEPTSPPQQLISDEEETHWGWIVTPKTTGEQILILSFDAVISIEGRDYKQSIRTFTKRIDVDVGWPETLGEWLELARKTMEDVSYLWAAILVPIGAAVWTLIRKRAQGSGQTRAGRLSGSDNFADHG